MKKYLLFLIILCAFLLRFWGIEHNPPALTWDEAAWGYNAYSLGIDGKDEFGRFLPITYIESFGDFKPPVYAYLSVLPVKVFGLNEFSTRFVSALFGVLTVVITYYLVKELFGKKKTLKDNSQDFANKLALLSSFFLAISPWHIMLSRAAFEANVATFFIAFGVYLFLLSLKTRWYLLLSLISFIISMYTFNTARIVVPVLVLGLGIVFWRQFVKVSREIIISILIAFIFFLPLFFFLRTPQAKLRFEEVNIFSDVGIVRRANQEIANDNNALWSKLIHNRRFLFSLEFFQHYFDNLSPSFLFIKGDGNPKFSVQDVGEMYIWEIPFFLAGIFLLFRDRRGYWWIIPFWLFLSIIPAATARETPHALRIEASLPTFQIISAYGLLTFLLRIKTIRYFKFALCSLGVIIIFNFLYFLHTYAVHYPKEFSHEWQYGYKDAVKFIAEHSNEYKKIYFTEALGRPYIYTLFYLQYPPSSFRHEAKIEREVQGFVHVRSFGKYYFVNQMPNAHGNILFIDVVSRVPKDSNKVAEFHLLDGKTELVGYVR